MKAPGIAAIVTAEKATFGIKSQAKGIAAAIGEDFEFLGAGMVAPDDGAFIVNRRLIKARASNTAGGGAALASVEPAVGAPGKTIGYAMGIFEPKTGESNFGIPLGDVVAIFIAIKQEIRSVHHPEAAPTADDRVRHVQALKDILARFIGAISIEIFVHANDVGSAIMMGRGGRDAIILRAIVLVASNHRETGRVGILAILRDPHAAPGVETEVGRLCDFRFAEQGIDGEVIVGL